STRSHSVTASAASYGDGTLGIGIAIGVGTTTVHTYLDGDASAGGDLKVSAADSVEENVVQSDATVGTGEITGKVLSWATSSSIISGVSSLFARPFSGLGVKTLQSTTSVNKFGLAGGVSFADLTTSVKARIGPGSVVSVGGDLSVTADAEERPQFSSISNL